MKKTALYRGACCAAAFLLAAGCDSSGSGPQTDGPGDGPAPRLDGSLPDIRPGSDLPPVVSDARDLPTPDLPALEVTGVPVDVSDSKDVPIASGVDGPGAEAQPAETGGLPQPYPDGGGTPCGNAGAACQTAADCCGLGCVAGFCAASACKSDGTACSAGGECCSSVCGTDGTCAALNPLCKTAGNACTTGAECCNGLCDANHQCAPPGQVSYCNQLGDICRADVECCTGVCNIVPGTGVGTCANITTACVIDGARCAGCGACCSHFCGPFGVGGPNICQPASGCRIEGDLCHNDSDCCGGDARSGLPGAGLVKCVPDPVYGGRIGKCSNPSAGNCPPGVSTCGNTCNPEGDVCHYTNTAVCEGATTSKRNNCCACISGKECCKLDRTGIPRCNAMEACVPAGGNCAFSGDCCNNLPCVPDATGRLTCGSKCVPLGGLCTTNGDCCAGTLCQVTPGSLAGTCVVPTTPPVTGTDAGVQPDSAVVVPPDGAVPEDAPPPPICAYFGQACSASMPCCGGIACVNNAFAACGPADTDCICFVSE